MAIIFTESFGWSTVGTDYENIKWFGGTGNVISVSGPGAWTGSQFASSITSSSQAELILSVPAALRYFAGGRFKTGDNLGGRQIFRATDSISSRILAVVLSTDSSANGTISVEDHTGTSIGSVTIPGYAGPWRYLEVDFSVGGAVVVRVDEVVKLSIANTETADISFVSWGCGVAGEIQLQDIVLLDTNAPNNSFLGDVHVECRLPSGAGALTQWTPLTGSNYANVDDTPAPDGDTSYVHSDTLGQRDYYAQPSIAEVSPTNIFAMAVYAVARTASAGAGGIRTSMLSSGTQLDAGSTTSPPPSFSTYSNGGHIIADVDPHTGLAWTLAAVNAAEPGIVLSPY